MFALSVYFGIINTSIGESNMATIVCDAEKVKAAAEKAIKAILQERSELDEAKIVKTMGKKTYRLEGILLPLSGRSY